MLWQAYVDESGDRGWRPSPPILPVGDKAGSSRIFTMSALLIPDGTQPAALWAWATAAVQIGRRPGDVVHWYNVKGLGQRKHLVSTITSLPDVQTISVALCKFHLPNATAIRNPDYLYGWTLRLLVERLSWFGDQHGDVVAMTFAQVRGLPPVKMQTYLQKLQATRTYIQWANLKMPSRIDTPANRRMLQLADTVSGAVFAAFEPDAYGFTEQSYIDMLKPVIWCRPWRKLYKDGIKFGPWPNPCRADHPWFERFCA